MMVICFWHRKIHRIDFIKITRYNCKKKSFFLNYFCKILIIILRRAQNANVRLLDAEQLKKTFKWLNTDGIELGSFGKSLVFNLKKKCLVF